MSKKVLWVIQTKKTDHIFPTLKAARASTAGLDAWFHGEQLRIISRIVLDKISRKGSHVRSTRSGST
jgi:hypothetical protein